MSMKCIWVLFFVMIALPSGALEANLVLKTSDGKKWPLVSQGTLRVSDHCEKKSCLALKKATLGSQKTKKKEPHLAPHPLAQACLNGGGEYVVGKYENGDEDGLCVFKDNSYILAMDYYKKVQGKKTP